MVQLSELVYGKEKSLVPPLFFAKFSFMLKKQCFFSFGSKITLQKVSILIKKLFIIVHGEILS